MAEIKNLKVSQLEVNKGQIEGLPKNPRFIKDERYKALKKSIEDAPEMLSLRELIVYPHGEKFVVIGGNMRLRACTEIGYKEIPCKVLPAETPAEKLREYAIKDNVGFGSDDFDVLANEWDIDELTDWGMELDFGEDVEEKQNSENEERNKLTDLFGIPPFSVLDTRQGYWQERKRSWHDIGIKSEIGRDAECLRTSFGEKYGRELKSGVSVFDPVLCEIAYKWFNVDGGKIYDCFAGGSVRGIVADKLGYNYTGIELRREQVDANYQNAKELGLNPNWICDDSTNVDKYLKDNSVDMIFSCPPYADLEVYSDNPNDLSNMDYEDFKKAYKTIIEKACNKLKQNRFAVFVVGDVRDKQGNYINFVDYTKECFLSCGLKTYNEMILVEMLGTAMLRVGQSMKSRKLPKCHQNILCFFKGDTKSIKDTFKEINFDVFENNSDDISKEI